MTALLVMGSWGLSLFVLFEHNDQSIQPILGSWGLSLFVLFELIIQKKLTDGSSWGLSLFVLFEPIGTLKPNSSVLED